MDPQYVRCPDITTDITYSLCSVPVLVSTGI